MIGGLVALVVGLKFRSAERIIPAVMETVTSADGSLSLNNFEYRDVKEGKARWTVRATTATYFEDRRETVLDQVKAGGTPGRYRGSVQRYQQHGDQR